MLDQILTQLLRKTDDNINKLNQLKERIESLEKEVVCLKERAEVYNTTDVAASCEPLM